MQKRLIHMMFCLTLSLTLAICLGLAAHVKAVPHAHAASATQAHTAAPKVSLQTMTPLSDDTARAQSSVARTTQASRSGNTPKTTRVNRFGIAAQTTQTNRSGGVVLVVLVLAAAAVAIISLVLRTIRYGIRKVTRIPGSIVGQVAGHLIRQSQEEAQVQARVNAGVQSTLDKMNNAHAKRRPSNWRCPSCGGNNHNSEVCAYCDSPRDEA